MCRPSSGCLENLRDYALRVVPFCGGGRDLVLQHESWKLVKIEINILRGYINCTYLIILTTLYYWPHATGMPHLKIREPYFLTSPRILQVSCQLDVLVLLLLWDGIKTLRVVRMVVEWLFIRPPDFLVQGIHKRMARFQKLIRNLPLTLHGHNVHRQQRKPSKFLTRYQQFASRA